MVGIIYSLNFNSPNTDVTLTRSLVGGFSYDALPTIRPAETGVSIIAVKEVWQPHKDE